MDKNGRVVKIWNKIVQHNSKEQEEGDKDKNGEHVENC